MKKIIVLPSSNNSKNRYRASRKAKREYQQSNDSHVRRAVFELHGGHLTTVKALSLPTPVVRGEEEVTGSCCLPQVALYAAGHRKS